MILRLILDNPLNRTTKERYFLKVTEPSEQGTYLGCPDIKKLFLSDL